MNTGGFGSFMNVTVREAVAVLPQASLAVNVLVAERAHPSLVILPSDEVMVTAPQASVAEAPGILPNTSCPVTQPRLIGVVALVNTGGVRSATHLTVRDVVAVLRHPSVAVNVLVLERLQPSLNTAPSDEVMVTAPQTSVADALPNEPLGSAGLQPRFTSA